VFLYMTKLYLKQNKLFPNNHSKKRYIRQLKSKLKKKYKIRKSVEYKLIQADNLRESNRLRKNEEPFASWEIVKAPTILSFIRNTEKVIRFINELRSRFYSKHRTFVDLSEVTELEHDALVILLSIMIRFKTSGIGFNGNFPKQESVRNILHTSGYLNSLYKEKDKDSDNYSISRNLIQVKANRTVSAKQSSRLILDATKTIWGEQRRCQGVQTAFIELMQNTNNHADPKNPGNMHCWISTKHYPLENKVSFTLLDFGLGIFETLKDKPEGNKFFKWPEIFKQKHNYQNNAELLSLILKGELHKTVTGHYFRGKGLPVLNELKERGQISNLVIVTNDVRADVQNDNFRVMKNSFHGTFVYWELSRSNKSAPLFI
jgi:hypothetical protein